MIKFLAVFLVSAVLCTLVWWGTNQGVQVGTPGSAKLQSVSYSPFRRGQSPMTGEFPSRHEMDSDLALLSGYVEGIRIYSGSAALGQIPELAKKHGLKVWLGAWLDSNEESNRREIDAVISLAKRFPETVDRVIVGNENLQRLDLPAERLRAYLAEVKQAVQQPVTYADGWMRWLENPEIADAVDVVTIHILPYWGNDPLPVDQTILHVREVLGQLRSTFPGKPIAIGEIGWPSYGRSRRGAVPGPVQQARFLEAVQTIARTTAIDYNIIEAFDQSWKIFSEGTVGGHWGLFSENRTKKYLPGEAMVPYPNWPLWASLATALAALLSVPSHLKYRIGDIPGIIRVVLLAQVTANLGILSTIHLWLPTEGWNLWLLMVVLQFLFVLKLIDSVARADTSARPATALKDMIFLLRPRNLVAEPLQPGLINLIYHAFAILGIVAAWGIVLHPRYRDFPTLIYLLPVCAIWLAALLHCRSPLQIWRWTVQQLGMQTEYGQPSRFASRIVQFREEFLVALMLTCAAILVVIRESLSNLEALGFSLVLLFLGLPYWGVLFLKTLPQTSARRCKQR